MNVLSRRALVRCGIAALLLGAGSAWAIAVAPVLLRTGGLTGVQAYAALISAVFGAFVGALLALGTGGTLGWRPVALQTVALGLSVFAVAAIAYALAARERRHGAG